MRIPGLVDLVKTADPRRVAALAGDERLDRRFDREGPLFNRFLAGRIRSTLQVNGKRLPALDARASPGRAEAQRLLEQRLAAAAFEERHLDALVAYVRGERDAPALGPLVQEAVGSLFRPGFRATPESWAAAVQLEAAPRTFNPLRLLAWRATGRTSKARGVLAKGVGTDPLAVHGVAIAVHSLVRSFEALRAQAMSAGFGLAPEEAVAQSIVAPENVLRQAAEPGDTAAGKVRRGTIVQLRLREAAAGDSGLAFMKESWSRCPAHDWVPRLMMEVWARAAARGGQPRPTNEDVMDPSLSLEWSRSQALSRRSIYKSLLGARLGLDLLLGLLAVLVPATLTGWLGLDGADVPAVVRLWGGVLLLAAGFQVPGLLEPVRWRWANATGLAGRSLLALLYVLAGARLVWLGLIEALFVAALTVTYFALFKAELMSRP